MLRAVLPSGRQPSFVKHIVVGEAGFEPAQRRAQSSLKALDRSAILPKEKASPGGEHSG